MDSSDLEKGTGQDVKTDLPSVVAINGDLLDIYTNSDNQTINIDINNGSRFCNFLVMLLCVYNIFNYEEGAGAFNEQTTTDKTSFVNKNAH